MAQRMEKLRRALRLERFGRPCRFLDPTTFIRVKRSAGRPEDLDAIAELEALEDESRNPS